MDYRAVEANIHRMLASSLCLVFAFLAGFFQGFFGCLLAWIGKQKKAAEDEQTEGAKPREPRTTGGLSDKWIDRLNLFGIIGSATLPGVLSIAALAFGAISMVVVVRSSSILVFNVIFTRVFQLGSIKKNDTIGTALCLIGIVALFKVAPTDTSITDADYVHLLTQPLAVAWICLLVLACGASITALLTLEKQIQARELALKEQQAREQLRESGKTGHRHRPVKLKKPPEQNPMARAALVSVVVASSSACMDLSAKGYTGSLGNTADRLFLASATFWLSLLVFIVSAVVMRGYYVYGCRACDVLTFIPLNTMMIIFLSAATGFTVMEEWRTVNEWDTFCASYLIIFLGINLLVSKEARDQIGRPGQGRGCSATLLEVQQLCTDLYTVGDQEIAIAKFEQLMEKALLLGEVENSELVALVVALLHELPGLPKQLIGDWLQLAYPSIFNYVQDTSTLPGHAITTGHAGPSEPERPRRRLMNRFLPSQESFNWASRYQSMLQDKIDPYAARLAGLAASRFHPESYSGGASDAGDHDPDHNHAAGTPPQGRRRILDRLGLGAPAAGAEGTPSLVQRAWHDASPWAPASLRGVLSQGNSTDPAAPGGAAAAAAGPVADGASARASVGGAHADATAGVELASRRLSPPHAAVELAQVRSEHQRGASGGDAASLGVAHEPSVASPHPNPKRGHGVGKYVGLADDGDLV